MVTRESHSPDPLALTDNFDDNEEIGECIVVARISPKYAVASTPKKRKDPVVEILTPKKRKKVEEEGTITASTSRKTPMGPRTPSVAGAGAGARASPTPNGKTKSRPVGSISGSITTPNGKSTSTPSLSKSTSTPKHKGTPTLASSLHKPLPTPPSAQNGSNRKRPRVSSPARPGSSVAKALTFDEEIFETPNTKTKSKEEISRETFLANEALKRQREARNFNYKGEASAPKLTRSGRVVGQDITPSRDSEELDEYGGIIYQRDEVNPLGIQAPIIPDVEIRNDLQEKEDPDITMVDDEEQRSNTQIEQLPKGAQIYLKNVLATLTSQGTSTNPPPFVDEEKNEALIGIVNLLKGTVERGEGNSALVVGPRGVGKTRTVARALNLLPSTSETSPIIVRLSGLAQTNDRLAIREMGRQIAEAEGKRVENDEEDVEEEGNDEEYAPTTLPSHLLALLTQPSPRAIIIVIEEFDLFTEHARQALLYCLLDVVQSIKTGPVETTGRGVAVLGITTRIDTLLLLEKRVKSRFSHRTFRIPSPISSEGIGWNALLMDSLIPSKGKENEEDRWKGDWQFAIQMLLKVDRMKRNLDRLTGLTTDVRNLYRPFILPVLSVLSSKIDFMSIQELADSVISQIEGAGWGLQLNKLKGLPHPALGVLIITKHLSYAGREEFNFAQVEEEYLRFSRTKLVGSGKVRWPIGVLMNAFDHLLKISLLVPASNASLKPQFQKVRCTLSPHEIVGWFKGEGANVLGPELGNWGRMMGGHA
ncbi:hypothetical protein I203_103136 [Kwoniella mangroviensis CBS 8507]|uniref:uncharacterized protein n=1 Tax=Kwoniella mangroviensis CBS 8507 TaxID=1296122 RepID=UPI00080D688D|nr:uncharacterized protein I203_07491 [Kwoniella mangroviensis CBS 8507]OCF63423.1 hypothetical protein I203_07491 [Kwoniella mangroviensis CBS 8507]